MPAAPPRRVPPAPRFRAEIEAAEGRGVARKAMTLRLTLNDSIALKRDRSLPVADISFADGTMSYLGVRVEEGGVSDSALDTGE